MKQSNDFIFIFIGIVYKIPKYRVKIRRARIGVYRTEYFSHFNILTAMASSGLKIQL